MGKLYVLLVETKNRGVFERLVQKLTGLRDTNWMTYRIGDKSLKPIFELLEAESQ